MMSSMRWRRSGRLLLVTGGSGFVGRHLVERAARDDWQVIAPPSGAMDVTRADLVAREIGTWRPHAVVHLAYRKDDRRNIVDGSRNVARAAGDVGARLVHVSTDVVFGGRPTPYTEADPVSPITDYGEWKAEAEVEVARTHPGAAIVRTSLVYGSEQYGHVERDVEQVLAGRSTTAYFTDEVRCPVAADDLAAALSALAARAEVTGPLHVAGPEAVDRATLARLVARRLGAGAAAERLPTTTLAATGLRRPGVVMLDCSRAAALGITCRPVSQVLAG
ncbi:MAG: sugar nucleotide-binding protein [Actinobacteria bacterium]|jgi:dTDP-4-dehydrorhamnose reductase|uniref:Unannotated protein n=1 Tax=freshwater metagenome TaxID=449393 RepID=A0A6J6EM44_9ZZZZ|nr:sugar nucleotide-binding protein [Actinomycetota bacterium]